MKLCFEISMQEYNRSESWYFNSLLQFASGRIIEKWASSVRCGWSG